MEREAVGLPVFTMIWHACGSCRDINVGLGPSPLDEPHSPTSSSQPPLSRATSTTTGFASSLSRAPSNSHVLSGSPSRAGALEQDVSSRRLSVVPVMHHSSPGGAGPGSYSGGGAAVDDPLQSGRSSFKSMVSVFAVELLGVLVLAAGTHV